MGPGCSSRTSARDVPAPPPSCCCPSSSRRWAFSCSGGPATRAVLGRARPAHARMAPLRLLPHRPDPGAECRGASRLRLRAPGAGAAAVRGGTGGGFSSFLAVKALAHPALPLIPPAYPCIGRRATRWRHCFWCGSPFRRAGRSSPWRPTHHNRSENSGSRCSSRRHRSNCRRVRLVPRPWSRPYCYTTWRRTGNNSEGRPRW